MEQKTPIQNPSIQKLFTEEKYHRFMQLSNDLATQNDMGGRIKAVSNACRDIIGTERASVFVVDHKFNTGNLYTLHADSVDAIFIPSGKGIVGECITCQCAIMSNAVQNDPRFYDVIDAQEDNDFITHNLIAVPLFSFDRKQVIGAIEILNKLHEPFNEDDIKILEFLSSFSSGMIEILIYR